MKGGLLIAWAIVAISVIAIVFVAYDQAQRTPQPTIPNESFPKTAEEVKTPSDFQPTPNNLPGGGKG